MKKHQRALRTTLLWALLTQSAHAQSSDSTSADADSGAAATLSLKQRSSTVLAQRWLSSDDDAERERALKRLGIASDAQSIELLIRSVQPDGQARTARLRLVALRSLSNFLDDAAVRRALVTLMSGVGQPPEAAADPLEALVRDSAAMALAASGRKDALTVLSKSLRQGGPTGRAAVRALTAYPPKEIKALLATPGAASVNLIEVLGALHDQRAFNALRSYVTRGTPEVRAAATLVLTEMGHMETIMLARHWLKTAAAEPVQKLAATRVLAMARTDDAAQYLEQLVLIEEQRSPAVRLAYEMPDPRLVPALTLALQHASRGEYPRALAALGRAGGSSAALALERELSKGSHASEAAYALALAPGEDATRILEQGLAAERTRRICARALVLRAASLGEQVQGLTEVLRAMLRGKDPSDRATAAFGLSALGTPEAPELLSSSDRDIVLAAARGAHRGETALAAARRLATEKDKNLSLALSNSLVSPRAQALVPSSKLRELVQTQSAAASLAARALGARLVSTDDPFVLELSQSLSKELRAEFALGLAEATAPVALGLLSEAYAFETEPIVRRAIIAAASRRKEPTRLRLLKLARMLDPDQQVRQLAWLGMAGHALSTRPPGRQTLWLSMDRQGADVGGELRPPIVVQTGMGHTLVAFPDPDGFVGLVGMDSGELSYVLAERAD